MKTIQITNKTGVHARPASYITKEAQKYTSEVFLVKDGKEFNAKSIMGILSMGIRCEDSVSVIARGDDADTAIDALIGVLEKINEEE